MNAKELYTRLLGLAVFRNLLDDPVLTALLDLLEALDDEEFGKEAAVASYGDLTAALYQETGNLTDYVTKLLFEDENPYVRQMAKSGKVHPQIRKAVDKELATLQEVCDLKSRDVLRLVDAGTELGGWTTRKVDLAAEYADRIANIGKTGYGIYAKYRAFTVKDGSLVPVTHPDEQSLDSLFGYEKEREKVIRNTEVLVEGGHAANILLYGDAGTGKSSTVKAVAKAYADQGLRLVEVRKEQLFQIPDLVEQLSDSPLKFILFIDDLSFSKNDDNFSALKAILEGSISASGDNLAVYATSNRRHLVKERMRDREGDELFTNDTLQEVSSLSARFGLTITYQRPDKDEYLAIVENLAKEYGVRMDPGEMAIAAEAFAIRMSGRTPRVAKQFIELTKAGIL